MEGSERSCELLRGAAPQRLRCFVYILIYEQRAVLDWSMSLSGEQRTILLRSVFGYRKKSRGFA
jgi:hypothetical protein